MLFTSVSLTGPVCHINIACAGMGTGADTYTTAAATSPAQIAAAAATAAASAATQALAAQQAAAGAAVIAPTILANFDLQNLPPIVKTCHLNHLDLSYLMTQNDMVPFPMPTGGVCNSFSHLDPPMGTGVTRQPDLNQVFSRNGRYFIL